ncbi:hypothetical protein C8J57DRAFT_1225850 [Mycena rebaudengoi]|nr:hypothetical protein C8J57DRAFT_1225850 [Mycena rebaudengoi]
MQVAEQLAGRIFLTYCTSTFHVVQLGLMASGSESLQKKYIYSLLSRVWSGQSAKDVFACLPASKTSVKSAQEFGQSRCMGAECGAGKNEDHQDHGMADLYDSKFREVEKIFQLCLQQPKKRSRCNSEEASSATAVTLRGEGASVGDGVSLKTSGGKNSGSMHRYTAINGRRLRKITNAPKLYQDGQAEADLSPLGLLEDRRKKIGGDCIYFLQLFLRPLYNNKLVNVTALGSACNGAIKREAWSKSLSEFLPQRVAGMTDNPSSEADSHSCSQPLQRAYISLNAWHQSETIPSASARDKPYQFNLKNPSNSVAGPENPWMLQQIKPDYIKTCDASR